MQSLVRVFNGNELKIDKINDEEFYVDVSGITKKYGKKFKEWQDTKRTSEIIKLYEKSHNLKATEMILRIGNTQKVHNKLLINFARFISVEFEVWCDNMIYDILMGDTRVSKELIDEQKKLEIKELSAKIDRENIKGHIEIAKMMQEINRGFDPMAYFDEVGIKSILPASMSLYLTNAMSDIRPNVPAYSATELIKEHKLSIRTPEFNNYLVELGLLDEYVCGGSIKKKFVHDSNWFGYNRHQSSTTKYPVTPFFYKDRSQEIVRLLKDKGYEI